MVLVCIAARADELNIPTQYTAAVQAGRERFSERCAFCHGGAGRGAKGPCLTCDRFRHGGSDQSLYANIAAGIPETQMGAFGTTLSREEILNIIAFLRAETARRKAAGELE
jgi:mono/diheme cytochrome c family protein